MLTSSLTSLLTSKQITIMANTIELMGLISELKAMESKSGSHLSLSNDLEILVNSVIDLDSRFNKIEKELAEMREMIEK